MQLDTTRKRICCSFLYLQWFYEVLSTAFLAFQDVISCGKFHKVDKTSSRYQFKDVCASNASNAVFEEIRHLLTSKNFYHNGNQQHEKNQEDILEVATIQHGPQRWNLQNDFREYILRSTRV